MLWTPSPWTRSTASTLASALSPARPASPNSWRRAAASRGSVRTGEACCTCSCELPLAICANVLIFSFFKSMQHC